MSCCDHTGKAHVTIIFCVSQLKTKLTSPGGGGASSFVVLTYALDEGLLLTRTLIVATSPVELSIAGSVSWAIDRIV